MEYDPSWERKRNFWGWNIGISIAVMVIVPLTAFLSTVAGMSGAFGRLGSSGADVGQLAGHISDVLVATMIGLCVAAVAMIWMIVAIVRFCTVPKPRHPGIHQP